LLAEVIIICKLFTKVKHIFATLAGHYFMKQITLQFPSIIEMLDFQALFADNNIHLNRRDITLTGKFTDADIEFAKAGYHAVVVEDKGQVPDK
jgi:hypothetical protein